MRESERESVSNFMPAIVGKSTEVIGGSDEAGLKWVIQDIVHIPNLVHDHIQV